MNKKQMEYLQRLVEDNIFLLERMLQDTQPKKDKRGLAGLGEKATDEDLKRVNEYRTKDRERFEEKLIEVKEILKELKELEK